MYDIRNEAHEFVGATREDAVAKACSYYDAAESDLLVRAFEGETVHGLGGRVVVVAQPASAPRPRPGGGGGGGREERGGRERGGRDRDRGGERDRGGRGRGGRDRDRGDRGGRGDRERGGRERGDRERGFQAEAEPPKPPSGPSVGTAVGELGPVGQFVRGVVERMKIGSFEISESREGELAACQLRGEAALSLGAGEGRTAAALQFIAGQAAQRIDESIDRVVVEVEGDEGGREDLLERAAGRAAQRAREGGRSVALDPMNGRDRRMVHMALRDEEGIATLSIGEGRYRQVLVVPEGAPEYDEAVDSSAQAAQDD